MGAGRFRKEKGGGWNVPELTGRLWRGVGSVRKALEGCWRIYRASNENRNKANR
jgi:hypothetical protein